MKTSHLNIFFLIFTLVFLQNMIHGQVINKPIKWIYTLPNNYQIGDTLEVSYRAKIDENWKMYSFDCDSIEYVQPAKFTVVSDESFEVISLPEFSKPIEEFDKTLERKVKVFSKEVWLIQKILVKKKVLKFTSKIDYHLFKEEDESGSVMLLSETF